MQITGTDATTNDLLVSLTLPSQLHLQGIYGIAPGWVLHGVQIGLELEELLGELRTIFFNFQASCPHTMITIALIKFP